MITKNRLVFLCLITSVMFLFPQLILRQPNLLDIAETWVFGRGDMHRIIQEFSDTERFRPLYLVTRFTLNALGNYHIQYYFIVFVILFSMTMYCIFLTQQNKRLSTSVVVMTTVLLCLSPVSIDTYWRLGTAENLYSLILVGGLYCLMRNKYRASVVVAYALMMAKETAIFYIPVFLFFLLYRRRFSEVCIILAGYIWYAVHLFGLTRLIQMNPVVYTAPYSLSSESVLDMFFYYMMSQIFYIAVFFISLLLFSLRIILRNASRRFSGWEYEVLFISVICMSLCSIVVFHNKYQPYYFFPSLVAIVLYFGWEMARASKIFFRVTLVYVGILFFLTRIPYQTWIRAEYWHNGYVGDGALVREIVEHSDTRIYEFDRFYRPEYGNVLEYLNRCHDTVTGGKCAKFQITKAEDGEIQDRQEVCGISGIGKHICTWAVGPELQ
jgi:hypothetical protein